MVMQVEHLILLEVVVIVVQAVVVQVGLVTIQQEILLVPVE